MVLQHARSSFHIPWDKVETSRIVATTGAIALNIVILMLLLVPAARIVMPQIADKPLIWYPPPVDVDSPKPPPPKPVPVTPQQLTTPAPTPVIPQPTITPQPAEQLIDPMGTLPADPALRRIPHRPRRSHQPDQWSAHILNIYMPRRPSTRAI